MNEGIEDSGGETVTGVSGLCAFGEGKDVERFEDLEVATAKAFRLDDETPIPPGCFAAKSAEQPEKKRVGVLSSTKESGLCT